MNGHPAPFVGPSWHAWSMEYYNSVDRAVANRDDAEVASGPASAADPEATS